MSGNPEAARRGREPLRLKDIPAPRDSRGAIGPLSRSLFAWPYRMGLAALYRAGAKAWQLTIASLLGNILVAWLLLTGQRFVPGLALLAAGIMDIFDGGIARLRGEATRAGAFLDSVMDRISDILVFVALFWSLSGQGHRLAAALSLTSLMAALLVSHVRAEGEAVGLSLTEGLLQRLERYACLFFGLVIPGALLPVLGLLTILGGLTVAQRVASGWRQLASKARAA